MSFKTSSITILESKDMIERLKLNNYKIGKSILRADENIKTKKFLNPNFIKNNLLKLFFFAKNKISFYNNHGIFTCKLLVSYVKNVKLS